MGRKSATNGSGAEATLQNCRESLRMEFESSRMGFESSRMEFESLRMEVELLRMGWCSATNGLAFGAEIKWLLAFG